MPLADKIRAFLFHFKGIARQNDVIQKMEALSKGENKNFSFR